MLQESAPAAWPERAWLPAVLLLAGVLRFWELGAQGLWADEAVCVVWASLPVGELLARLASDTQSPLYFLLLKAWMSVLGDSEASVRALSAVAGLLAVRVLARTVRRVSSWPVAAVSALLLAVSPMAVHYARETRAFGLFILTVTLALDALVVGYRRPGARGTAYLALATTLLLYTHNLGVFYGAAFYVVAALLPTENRAAWWRTLLVAGGASAVLFLPWLPTLVGQAQGVTTSYAWLTDAWERLFPWQVPTSLLALTPGAGPPVRNGIDALGWVAVVTGVLGWFAAAWNTWRTEEPTLKLALGATVVPLLMIFAYSAVAHPIHVVGRVDAAAVVPAAWALGAAVTTLPRVARVVGLATLLAASMVPLGQEIALDTRSQERAIARGLADAMGQGDVLVVATAHRDTFAYYLQHLRPEVTVRGFPTGRDRNAFVIDENAPLPQDAATLEQEVRKALVGAGGRHVFVLSQPGPFRDHLHGALSSGYSPAGGQEVGFLQLAIHRFALAGAP
ncbi:MAG: glycosyltransferase family 39 protein [Myxococcota bacterium]